MRVSVMLHYVIWLLHCIIQLWWAISVIHYWIWVCDLLYHAYYMCHSYSICPQQLQYGVRLRAIVSDGVCWDCLLGTFMLLATRWNATLVLVRGEPREQGAMWCTEMSYIRKTWNYKCQSMVQLLRSLFLFLFSVQESECHICWTLFLYT